MVAVAGGLLFLIPEPDNDPVAEVYAVGSEADPDSPTTNGVPESTYEVSGLSAQRSDVRSSDDASLVAVIDGPAPAELGLDVFARATTAPPSSTTTSAAPTTTTPPTTAAPTTEAPTTTPPTTVETTEASEPEESTGDSATTVETTETTVAEEEPTTTEAPATTAADNGFVNAGHGVYVPPILLKIRWCESTDNYTAANPSSSARGAYQFLTGSWAAYGHADRYGVSQAHLASPAQQDEAALITWQRDGTRPWLASKHCWG